MRNSLWPRLGAAVVFACLAVLPPGQLARAQQQPAIVLTAAEQAQIKALQQQAQGKFLTIQKNTALTQAQKNQQLQALQDWFRTQSLAVLTPQQKAIVVAKQALLKTKVAQLKTLESQLKASLSSKQQADIQALKADQDSQLKALIANKALTDVQKRDQFQAMQSDNQSKFNAILTPAQLNMLGQLTALRGEIQTIVGQGQQPQ